MILNGGMDVERGGVEDPRSRQTWEETSGGADLSLSWIITAPHFPQGYHSLV
jgi:hypothetical protein